MKITIPRDQLVLGLSRVLDCAHTSMNMPALCSVLLEAGSALSLSTSKLDLSATTSIAADVAKVGAIALPAKRLMQVVKEMPNGPISIEAKGERATIKAGPATFQMAGFAKKDFPEARAISEKNKLESSGAAIANMLASVAYSASQEQKESTILNGVHLSIKGGKLTTEATNRKRIATNSKTVDSTHEAACIIPNATVAVLRRALAEALAVTISFDDTGLYVAITHGEGGGTTTIQSAIISGQFPDVSRAIPKETFHPATANSEALATMLRRVSIATDELSPFCRFHFEPKKLTVYAISKAFGEAEESIEITYAGPEIDIGLKPRDILEPMEAIGGETTSLEVLSGVKPCIIRGQDSGFLCLIAPVPLT